MTEYLVEGWTERIVETLTTDGAAQNLSGVTVTLMLYDNTDTQIAYGGTAGIDTAADGKVYFDPAAGDLLASKSPYSVRWKVTDGSGKVAYWPAGQSDAPVKWNVDKP